ncbi:hypothetical protein C7M84_009074 [Penaeus vannamei]|uniref:RNA-directed DNA polymerase n=1 Tax=Penaeus vannamei TaxID=6689 RepID=A0A3R7M5H5_PENVA|nr:hypothetical protein C7M84_009074 [Penaeus vannamei]
MAKVESIQQLPAPTSRKDVMRFLGMAGYYRRFCPNSADVASPLTALVSPKEKFVWSSECQAAFEKIRSILMTKPVLKSPDFSQPFVLQVDASDVAAGAVLLQAGDGGVLHPVSFMSMKFKVIYKLQVYKKQVFKLVAPEFSKGPSRGRAAQTAVRSTALAGAWSVKHRRGPPRHIQIV